MAAFAGHGRTKVRAVCESAGGLPAGGFSLTFDTVEGRLYHIRRSTDLENWQTIDDDVPGTGAPINHQDNPGIGPKFFDQIEVKE